MSRLQKNWLEWSVFAVGLVLVLFTLGYLAYVGATMGDEPPNIEVRLGTPERRPHNFIVPVALVNHGDQTAESVTVEVVLESEGQQKERGELVVAFLPRRATHEGWVAFNQDPRTGELKARVLGYGKP
ncbi:MAG TPA: hypothetical protein VGB73_01570 [Pyrinomonadaceae bacterium]|jgi:uncharacterized protein (TIGR02588 family)